MPTPSLKLIKALRTTADRVEAGARYEWGHMAHCNCGHLAQTVSNQTGAQISKVVKHALSEWTEHATDICDVSGNPVEELLDVLREIGFTREDVMHLEWLSDKRVLRKIGLGIYLQRNDRNDLITYLRTMADMLEEDLAIKLSQRLNQRMTG